MATARTAVSLLASHPPGPSTVSTRLPQRPVPVLRHQARKHLDGLDRSVWHRYRF
jgi:hypothetical protein